MFGMYNIKELDVDSLDEKKGANPPHRRAHRG
jgi:hypothetical protein